MEMGGRTGYSDALREKLGGLERKAREEIIHPTSVSSYLQVLELQEQAGD